MSTEEEGITVHKVFQTDFPADCAEFCHHRGSGYPLILACGTYFLKDPETQTKEGAVELYTVRPNESSSSNFSSGSGGDNDDDDDDDNNNNTFTIERVQRFTTGAVFDLKWCQTPTPSMLIARADGYLSLHSAPCDTTTTTTGLPTELVSPCATAECNPGEGPVTYVANVPGDRALCCHGGGRCSLWDLNTLSAGPTRSWTGHEYETWVAAASAAAATATGDNAAFSETVWTGGDDGYIRGWDLRTDCNSALFEKRRDMGITAISFHPVRPVVAVGSYDESLTLWDARFPRRPLFTADSAATEGGGVWRLKWHGRSQDTLLAACMHAGYRVFELGAGPALEWTRTYHGPHKSLAYGADWAPAAATTSKSDGDGSAQFLAATCSFYDNTLSFWSFTKQI